MENIYNAIQNLYNMDKTTWQEVLAELYNLVSKVENKIDLFENKFDLFENKFGSLLGEEVTIELKKMYDDGSLASLINDKLLKDINTKVDVFKTEVSEQLDTNVRELENSKASKVELDIERKRIDSFISLPEGSTTGDAELIDGRIGADGVTYENIGTSIREQFKKVNKVTNDLSNSYVSTFEDLSINVLENWIEATGVSNKYNNFKHIEIVGVKTGEIYRIKNQCGVNVRAYVLKNANGTVISTAPEQPYGTYNNYTLELTIPHTADGGTLYVNTFTDTYIGVQTVSGIVIDSMKLTNKNIFLLSNLFGKKIIFFGDSITANKGSWGDADTIRAKYNMTGVNYAVGGMTYTILDSSNDSNNIYLRMKSKLSDILDADYICFQGATNDAFRGVPLGEMLDEDDFTTEVSTATFAGAFEMSCRLLRTQVPGAKLLYLTNIKIPRNKNLGKYVNIAKQICNKYSIKYLDLWNDSGMCSGIQSFNDKYYSIDSSVSMEHGDETHPTAEGYKVHLNDKVDFALNSL